MQCVPLTASNIYQVSGGYRWKLPGQLPGQLHGWLLGQLPGQLPVELPWSRGGMNSGKSSGDGGKVGEAHAGMIYAARGGLMAQVWALHVYEGLLVWVGGGCLGS